MAKDVKNEVLYRVYFLLFGIILPIAILFIYQTAQIAVVEGDYWRRQGKKQHVENKKIEADRGNIHAADGSLLASSIPFYDIYFDPVTSQIEDFMENLDSLAYCLATYVDESFTVGGYREFLLQSRRDSLRYLPIKKKVSYQEKKFIEKFPLFKLGQNRGGFIANKRSERKRPFGILAHRTIGYVRENARPVGLEGTFDNQLGGKAGEQTMILVDSKEDIWMPLDDLTKIEPKSGDDIITTLDIDLQDIVEKALLQGVEGNEAEWGAAILMDVQTGAIKAIANIGRTEDGKYWETYNNAIGSATEPGSTFKLASIMALLEDGFVDLNDTIDIEYGRTKFSSDEVVMEDATSWSAKLDTISVRRAFEISSNVGIAKLVEKYYGRGNKENDNKGAALFIERLKQFNLHLPTGIVEIQGEGNPYIKEAYNRDDDWSGITLPWMSTGYELRLTPLQLLTFYNAVANDGQLMKPYIVSEIQSLGKTVERFKPVVIKQNIASRKTINQAQALLEGVVERGTGMKLRSENYQFAGKTGTAQINYKRGSRGTRVGGYQASFAGYFPVKEPLYSCVVVVRRPRKGKFYGGDVAGPIFREIADGCFNAKIQLHEPQNLAPKPRLVGRDLPHNSLGEKNDLKKVLGELQLDHFGDPGTEMAILQSAADSLVLNRRTMATKQVPNVVGLGLRDALFILENRGLKVEVRGFGKVVRQSIRPGTRIKGQDIVLTLG